MAFDVRDLVDEGSSAAVYRLPEKQVLKLFRDGMAEELVRYEYDAARFAHDLGIFVGRPVEMRRLDDRWGIIFEDLERPTLRVELNRKPLRQWASLKALAERHAQIHQHPGKDHLVFQRHALLRRIESAHVSDALKCAALNVLDDLPVGDRLCHGDLHPGNAIMTGQGLAIIDWFKASIGHPATDIARTELLLRFAQYGVRLRHIPLLRVRRHVAAASYLRFYAKASGLALNDISHWRLPVGVAWLQGQDGIHEDGLRKLLARLARKHVEKAQNILKIYVDLLPLPLIALQSC
jgi:Predicted aminoglycoside phosphotransferase